jgi:hypothetical protein
MQEQRRHMSFRGVLFCGIKGKTVMLIITARTILYHLHVLNTVHNVHTLGN